MLRQPKLDFYFDGLNETLLRHVPTDAKRIVEVGCGRGRMGLELKRLDPQRHVIGIEVDPVAAEVAASRLDQVHVHNLEHGFPELEAGTFDCVIFGDVLEHLIDPETTLLAARQLLTDSGTLLVSVPNIGHLSIIKALVRADLMYQPAGLLDATHLRFFTHATFIKMMLDVGLLPDVVDSIRSGGTEHVIPAATPLLEYFRVPPTRALGFLDTYQYIVKATKLPDIEDPGDLQPISFAVLINDRDQLESNLLRSPCLWEGSPHELISLPDQASAAEGLSKAMEVARHDLVVLVQQDMYLPACWDSRFIAQLRAAEQQYGQLGVVGLFGLRYRGTSATNAGRVVDRERLLDFSSGLPAKVDSIDEVLLCLSRSSPLRADPALGFHLYGADLCLQAERLDLPNVVVDAPAFHNSLFAEVDLAFHRSREALLAKWPEVRPLYSNMGRLDEARTPTPPAPEPDLAAELEQVRVQLKDTEARLSAVLGSRTWRWGTAAGRVLRRGR